MQITDIKIRHIANEERLKAIVSVTFDGKLAVHDIKIIEKDDKTFVAMPSKKLPDGTYRDIVHPINQSARTIIEEAILKEYETVKNSTLRENL